MHISDIVNNISPGLAKSASKGYFGNLDKLFLSIFNFEQIQKEFPYHVVVELDDCDFQQVCNWCFTEFGYQHGECEDLNCEFSWMTWYFNSDIKKDYDNKVKEIKEDKTISNEVAEDKTNELHNSHFNYLTMHYFDDTEPGSEHSHKGVWKTESIISTGYDLEYIAFCFKKKEDAMLFALRWR